MAYTAAAAIPTNASNPTLSDTTVHSPPYLGFLAQASGTISVMPAGQEGLPSPTPVTYTVVAGQVAALQISRFRASGTTLSGSQIIAYGPN